MFPKVTRVFASLAALTLLLLAGCQTNQNLEPEVVPASLLTGSSGHAITLGDVEPEEPTKKLKRFQPLADYLADNLQEYGVEVGIVVLARDIEEMAGFLKDGTVDVYFDSVYPSLAASNLSGSRVIVRRWKQGDPTYWSTFITLKENGLTSPEDLLGKVVAFEAPFSTSGFVLPAGTLIQRGFTLRQVDGPDAPVASDEIGYFFSGDEENTVELLLRGRVAAGGVSNQDYEGLPAELKEQIGSFDRTIAVPRQLVTVRPGLEPEIVARIQQLLIGLEEFPQGLELLAALKKTAKFDLLPPEAESAISEFKALMKLLPQ